MGDARPYFETTFPTSWYGDWVPGAPRNTPRQGGKVLAEIIRHFEPLDYPYRATQIQPRPDYLLPRGNIPEKC